MTPKHFQNRMLTNQGSVPANESPHSLDALSLVSDLSGTLEIVDGEIVIHVLLELSEYVSEDMGHG